MEVGDEVWFTPNKKRGSTVRPAPVLVTIDTVPEATDGKYKFTPVNNDAGITAGWCGRAKLFKDSASADSALSTNSRQSLPGRSDSLTVQLPPNCGEATDPQGRTYFYNTITRESRWDLPGQNVSETPPKPHAEAVAVDVTPAPHWIGKENMKIQFRESYDKKWEDAVICSERNVINNIDCYDILVLKREGHQQSMWKNVSVKKLRLPKASSQRRLMERLARYEAHYSSGKPGHPEPMPRI